MPDPARLAPSRLPVKIHCLIFDKVVPAPRLSAVAGTGLNGAGINSCPAGAGQIDAVGGG